VNVIVILIWFFEGFLCAF